MENWHLFTAAFVLSLVDLSVLGAFLWYQFSTLYFAWHLCPMIVNRVCELIAFMFTGGMLPSLFAIVQVPLSLFSTTIYANRQQRLQNRLLLAVYCTLLVYESLVAVLLIKMGRYLKHPVSLGLQQSRSLPGQQATQPYIAFHMFALFTQPLGSGCPYISNLERRQVMLGKVLPSKFEPLVKAGSERTREEGGNSENDVTINIMPLAVPSEVEHGHNACSEVSVLPAQVTPCGHSPAVPTKSGPETSTSQAIALPSEIVHSDILMPTLESHAGSTVCCSSMEVSS